MTRRVTIRTKLAAALAVPLIALAAFAALQVRDAFDAAEEVGRQADFATAATGPSGIITALSDERNYQAVRSIGFVDAVALPVDSIESAERNTDASLRDFRANLGILDIEAASQYRPALQRVENGLKDLRAEGDKLGEKPSLDQAAAGSALFGEYTDLLHGLLDANGMVALPIDDSQLRTGVELLDGLARQNDIEGRIIRDGAMAGLLKDRDAALEATLLAGAQQEGEGHLRVLADGPYTSAVMTVLNSPGRAQYDAAMQSIATDPMKTDLQATLDATPRGGSDQLMYAQQAVAKIVDARSTALTDAAEHRERNYAIAALGSLLLAIFLLALANRWITRPLRKLADQAGEIATERLPAAVQTILDTPANEEITVPDVEPVSIRAGGEVREVANALNRVQDSAIELAVDQAVLRRNIADAYVNLGRRNQNLLARQLEFISQLEDDAADPETLESLFRLDHLATRMRRNAESLLVLAGLEPPRTWSAPLAVGDVVRGALGEVEGYQRVRLRHLDDATIDGAAAADISHVIAELVENALSFSPPDAEVDLFGRRYEGQYVLSIVDCGIGMSVDDLERANDRLAGRTPESVAPSRYLGHYVVAQLAARHGILVHLGDSPSGGLAAALLLPTSVLTSSDSEAAPPVEALVIDDDADGGAPQDEPVVIPHEDNLAVADAATASDTDTATDAAADSDAGLPRRTPSGPAPVFQRIAPEPSEAVGPEPVGPEPVGAEPVTPEPETPQPVASEVLPAEPVAADPVAAEPIAAAPSAPLPFAASAPPLTGPIYAADAPEPATPPAPPTPHPEFATPVVDHRAVFAEVAGAVASATAESTSTPSGPPPNSTWSEDFIPDRSLPKRSRRDSKLKSPWTRDRSAQAQGEAQAAPPVPTPPAPVPPLAVSPPTSAEPFAPSEPAPFTLPPVHARPANPLGGLPEVPPAAPTGAPGAVRFGPELPTRSVAPLSGAAASNGAQPHAEDQYANAAVPGDASAEGSQERFAFFAAFRAAAEQAREDAGIENQRGTP